MVERGRGRGGSIIGATVFTLVCLAILIGLGVWQLERKVWKENLIASLTERLAKAPQDLPPREEWPRQTAEADEFRRVTFPAEFIPGEEALVYAAGSALRKDIKGPGYFVFAPARLAGGSIVIVNRGFVPLDRKELSTRADSTPQGLIDIVGVMRWPESRGMFTPADDVKGNVWYLRDTKAMADAKKWNVAAPFYIDQEAPVPAGGFPLPGRLEVHLPDNHLQYAITWFGLALALVGVYVFWLVARLRRR
ncbi:SURF1 family protein [Pseudolabrys taiwanensis]|uniref:SURF1-like protein n=1 Tax=Pseudolabrys taiwanensis TaxID=331696 RepID=A0A345ZXI5_9HYPH|nr:SURF1 family protein [Pseudolabrys taiwanensis]AXK81632.1 SURF1 family protein [Pseudolabrys taiwanensis]